MSQTKTPFRIYHVTTLEFGQPGSLDQIPRGLDCPVLVVFDVSGTFVVPPEYASTYFSNMDNVYVFGNTSPGGVQITGEANKTSIDSSQHCEFWDIAWSILPPHRYEGYGDVSPPAYGAASTLPYPSDWSKDDYLRAGFDSSRDPHQIANSWDCVSITGYTRRIIDLKFFHCSFRGTADDYDIGLILGHEDCWYERCIFSHSFKYRRRNFSDHKWRGNWIIYFSSAYVTDPTLAAETIDIYEAKYLEERSKTPPTSEATSVALAVADAVEHLTAAGTETLALAIIADYYAAYFNAIGSDASETDACNTAIDAAILATPDQKTDVIAGENYSPGLAVLVGLEYHQRISIGDTHNLNMLANRTNNLTIVNCIFADGNRRSPQISRLGSDTYSGPTGTVVGCFIKDYGTSAVAIHHNGPYIVTDCVFMPTYVGTGSSYYPPISIQNAGVTQAELDLYNSGNPYNIHFYLSGNRELSYTRGDFFALPSNAAITMYCAGGINVGSDGLPDEMTNAQKQIALFGSLDRSCERFDKTHDPYNPLTFQGIDSKHDNPYVNNSAGSEGGYEVDGNGNKVLYDDDTGLPVPTDPATGEPDPPLTEGQTVSDLYVYTVQSMADLNEFGDPKNAYSNPDPLIYNAAETMQQATFLTAAPTTIPNHASALSLISYNLDQPDYSRCGPRQFDAWTIETIDAARDQRPPRYYVAIDGVPTPQTPNVVATLPADTSAANPQNHVPGLGDWIDGEADPYTIPVYSTVYRAKPFELPPGTTALQDALRYLRDYLP